jgi:Zn-dependent M16 (insulinase) family peptidase
MTKAQTKHGFLLKDSQEIAELKMRADVYEHVKSGAQLIHLACEDTNKLFCVAFKTVPTDSTGVPHIIEHSVLNGSRLFPAKNSFMELIKGSLNTFVNAMTAPDLTLYPVASTNDKDFMNLSRVYMDAVFFPRIYEQPEILHQEGWHYELFDKDDELAIRGVVYNEMKGVYSSPDALLRYAGSEAQFPDTTYGVSSGGDPKHIPELTYEAFVDFHRKHYHPSNSKTILYGDLDIDAMLEMMDKDYLSHFDKDPVPVVVEQQKPFKKAIRVEEFYPADEQSGPGMCHLSLNYTWGMQTDMEQVNALSVLVDMLMNSTASPLKRKIMESGLAGDSYGTTNLDILQPTFGIICKYVQEENIEPLIELINTELKRIVKEGFDKKLIEATLNSREFFYREGQMQNFPKGLYYAWTMYGAWIHGADPLYVLKFEPLLEALRKGLTEPYYEKLMEASMLKNPHHSVVVLKPKVGLLQEDDAKLREELAQHKAAMSEEEIQELIKFNQDLQTWQMTKDSPEDLAKIPALTLADINPEAESYPTEVETWKEFTLLKHEVNTNGIVYLKAYFDLAHADEDEIPWLALYAYLMGRLDSENCSFAELSNEIDIHTGGIDLRFNMWSSYQEPDIILPKFVLSGKAVTDKCDQLVRLVSEYAFKPRFTDHQRLRTLIKELKNRMEAMMMMQGHSVAITRMFAAFSQLFKWRDLSGGLAFYHWLCELEKKMEEDITPIVEELEWVRKTFFTSHNLIVSLTSDAEGIDRAFDHLGPMVANISKEAYAPVESQFETIKQTEGIGAPVQVQFVAKGGNFFYKGYSYSGKLRVVNNILSSELLYQELRVKGGAYGAMCNFSPTGFLFFCSYRDPNLRETLDTYDQVPKMLREYTASDRDMEKYIIGVISDLDKPKTPEQVGAQGDEDYITGFTQEDRQQIRTEVLGTTLADVRKAASLIEALMKNDHICVFGNEEKINENADLFTKITPLFPKQP